MRRFLILWMINFFILAVNLSQASSACCLSNMNFPNIDNTNVLIGDSIIF